VVKSPVQKSMAMTRLIPLTAVCGLLLMSLSGCGSQPQPATTPTSIKAALGGPNTPLPPSEVAQLTAWNAQRAEVQRKMAAAHFAGKPLPKVPQPAP
jgi:hypothetical protein